MNAEQPIPFPENLEEDWAVSELTDAPVEPSPEIPDHLLSVAEPLTPLLVPSHFPEHPKDFLEPEQTELQRLLYAVAAERPAMDGDDIVEMSGSDTYYLMDALAYPMQDADMCMIAHWARRVGFMLEGVPFRRSGKMHWEFDDDILTGERYEQVIEWALAEYESEPIKREQLHEIVAFVAGSEYYHGIARDMIGLSLAQIRIWRDLQAARLTRYVVRRIEREASDDLWEPSPTVLQKAGPNRFSAGDLEQLSLQEIMNEQGEVLSIGIEDELDPHYMALIRIASMTRRLADDEYESFMSFKEYCGTIARQLSDQDTPALRRVVHNARFAAFIVAGVNYSKRHWQVREHAIANAMYQSHELAEVADNAASYVEGDKLLSERLELFLKFIAMNDEDVLLARRVACLTLEQIAKWRIHQHLEQDGLRD